MKLISLNTWGGKLYKPLSSFLKEQSKTVDVFCFQEVLNIREKTMQKSWKNGKLDLYDRISRLLTGFNGFITEPYSSFGERMAIFTSKHIHLDSKGVMTLIDNKNAVTKTGEKIKIGSKLQWITFNHKGKEFTIANIHGFWIMDNKDDSPERIKQSDKVIAFLNSRSGGKVLCGDFNLLPNTSSIKMLEKDMANLIKKYKIKTTRSSFTPVEKGKFADYVFTSKIKVNDFKVLNKEVSDHLPLLLDFK